MGVLYRGVEDFMIKITNVYKAFGNNEVLKGVDLEIEKGQTVVIIGPSGSGKTTFLRCINYLEKADKGKLCFEDQEYDLNLANKDEILSVRRRTAMVFQDYNLFFNKTALGNVMQRLVTVKKMTKDQAREIALDCLDKVGLLERADYYSSQLSGGQQQRIGIARAIALNPEVILFDEPTSSLDPELIGEVLSVIKKVAKEGRTMIIVTHEIPFAAEVADKVVFIDKGVVVEQGTADEVIRHSKEERTRKFLERTLKK